MDDDLRGAQRAWEQAPADPAAGDGYARALRRAGLPVPLALLEARRLEPRRLETDAALDVACVPDGDDEELPLGLPSRQAGLDVPACREWWLAPEGASFQRLLDLSAEVEAPHVEGRVAPKQLRAEDHPARSLHVSNELGTAAWSRVARMPRLERACAQALPLAGGPRPDGLAALGLQRLTAADALALAGWPPLTALHASRSHVGLDQLAGLPSLRGLESLAFGVEWAAKADRSLAPLVRWPGLRRLWLGGRERLDVGAQLPVLRELPRLEALRLDSCLRLGDAGVEAVAALGGLRELRAASLEAVSAGALGRLLALPDLRRLEVTGWRRSGPGDALAGLRAPRLRTLRVAYFDRGGGEAELDPAALPELRRLRLELASPASARRVAALPGLEELETHEQSLGAATLEPLAACARLRRLALRIADGAHGALGALLAAAPVETLCLWTDGPLAPDLLVALARGRALRRLEVHSRHRTDPVDVSPLAALEGLEDLAIIGPAVASWAALDRLPRLRVVRGDRDLPRVRQQLPHVHATGNFPRPRPEWFA